MAHLDSCGYLRKLASLVIVLLEIIRPEVLTEAIGVLLMYY